MRVIALRRLTVQGRKVEAGEEFDLPHSLDRFVKLGWVRAADDPRPVPETRIKPAPETRVEPKPVTRKKTKPKPKQAKGK